MENTIQKTKNEQLSIGETGINSSSERMLILNLQKRTDELEKISQLLSDNLEQNTLSTSQQRYLNFLSKEKDRTHKQLLSTLELLRHIKMPSIKVNVSAKSAFLGQNQINASK